MEDNAGNIDFNIIKDAQLGSKESMSSLVKLTKRRVFTFLYRATLDYHLSEDLCQDTMLDMIKSIKRLELSGEKSLLAWLFRTALGKVQHHYRVQGSTHIDRKSLINSETISRVVASRDLDPVRVLTSKEAIEIILDSIAALSVEYRSVLTLRCFDQMSYAEIASVVGGTQFRTKMLIYRARRILKRQLAHKGIGRSQLLGALGVFACITASPSKGMSAACVTGAGLKVGLPAAILSTAATKSGIVVTSIVAALALSTSVTLIPQEDLPSYVIPSVNEAQFAFPSTVISSDDPEGDGFKAVNTNGQPFAATPEQILVGKPSDGKPGLILPSNHSVELGFSGEICDGYDHDISISGRGCWMSIGIELTDGTGHRHKFNRLGCDGSCDSYHVKSFDIEGMSLPFEPSAIRITGMNDWGPHKGFELCSVQAKIFQQQSTEPK